MNFPRRALLILSFLLSANAWTEERTVRIESARVTEYVKRPSAPAPVSSGEGGESGNAEGKTDGASTGEYGEEILRFSGDVVIVVTEG